MADPKVSRKDYYHIVFFYSEKLVLCASDCRSIGSIGDFRTAVRAAASGYGGASGLPLGQPSAGIIFRHGAYSGQQRHGALSRVDHAGRIYRKRTGI